jgi:hypothetical protein
LWKVDGEGASHVQRDWHPDPFGRFQLRYFDGVAWTAHVSSNGQQGIDPVGTTPSEVVTLIELAPDAAVSSTPRVTQSSTERRDGDRRASGRRIEDHLEATRRTKNDLKSRLSHPLTAIPLVIAVLVTVLFIQAVTSSGTTKSESTVDTSLQSTMPKTKRMVNANP